MNRNLLIIGIVVLIGVAAVIFGGGLFLGEQPVEEPQAPAVEDALPEEEITQEEVEEPASAPTPTPRPAPAPAPQPEPEPEPQGEYFNINGDWYGNSQVTEPASCSERGPLKLEAMEEGGVVSGFVTIGGDGRLPLDGTYDGKNLSLSIYDFGNLYATASGTVNAFSITGTFVQYTPCGGSDTYSGTFFLERLGY